MELAINLPSDSDDDSAGNDPNGGDSSPEENKIDRLQGENVQLIRLVSELREKNLKLSMRNAESQKTIEDMIATIERLKCELVTANQFLREDRKKSHKSQKPSGGGGGALAQKFYPGR